MRELFVLLVHLVTTVVTLCRGGSLHAVEAESLAVKHQLPVINRTLARYRKEAATGGLDDTQLRTIEDRLTYLRELEQRRAAILKSIEEQGKLTPELAAALHEANTKARLEDLLRPNPRDIACRFTRSLTRA